MKRITKLALAIFASLIAAPAFAGQDIFINDSTQIHAADCGDTFWIDATHSQPVIAFDSAATLTANGAQQCQVTLKKLDLTSNQITITSTDVTVDGYYWDRRLIEPMDAVTVAAIMNPITHLGGLYVLSRGEDHNEMRAMRTVTRLFPNGNYNVNPYDYEVEHRCNTAAVFDKSGNQLAASGPIFFYLPPLKQVIGVVPNPGQTPNPNDPTQPAGYLPKTFHFTVTDNGGAPCYLIAFSGDTINGQPYIEFTGLYNRITAQAKGDGWTAQLLSAAP